MNIKSIANAKLSCSPIAYDLLKLAIDGYDYPFLLMNLKAIEPSKNIKSLLESIRKVWT